MPTDLLNAIWFWKWPIYGYVTHRLVWSPHNKIYITLECYLFRTEWLAITCNTIFHHRPSYDHVEESFLVYRVKLDPYRPHWTTFCCRNWTLSIWRYIWPEWNNDEFITMESILSYPLLPSTYTFSLFVVDFKTDEIYLCFVSKKVNY